MRKFTPVLVVLALVCVVPTVRGQASPYEQYLTVADVEKAGSLSGIKLVPYDPSKGAGGSLNFGLADGTVVLIASFQTLNPKDYDSYKNQIKPYIRKAVEGIGEDAFDGPPGNYPYFITFRKGNWVVSISTFFNPAESGKTYLSMDQLAGLCKTVAGRL